jgi:D-alanyl-D-alanine dipeptidase
MLLLTVLLIGAVSSFSSGSVVNKHGIEKIGTHNLTGNQYVTMAEVVAMQQQQQHKFEIALLAMKSQLEQKLSLSNDTLTPVVQWQQKYNDLKTNNIRLQHTYNHLLDKYIAIEKELILVRNQSSELSTKLGKVNNVTLEQDMHSLQQQVKSIGIKTYLLVSNDRNRNRDIAALYNKNADSEKRIASLVSETINNFDRIEHDQHVTVINMGRRFDDFSTRQTVAYDSLHKKIDEVDQSQNLTATAMNKQLEDYEIQNNMKVDGLLQRATQTNEKGMSLYILLKVNKHSK